MSTIFSPIPDTAFEFCEATTEEDTYRVEVSMTGAPVRESWNPVTVVMERTLEGRNLRRSDAPVISSSVFYFRRGVLEAMWPLLASCGEALPVLCETDELSLFNAFSIPDSLDLSTSTIERYPNGAIMRIVPLVFRPEVIQGRDAFRVTDFILSPTFVSERFVTLWHQLGFQGLWFNPVWSSSGGDLTLPDRVVP